MTPERYAVIQAVFTRARRVAQADRAALVARECAGDEELRREVESLLAHADTPLDEVAVPAALQREAADLLANWQNPEAAAYAPRQVGPYRIREILGEGGMGVVYLAEQTAPVQRQVALKLIKLGMDTREVVARFESERQALALMNHPNVARVLDAGATAEGRPYFVMEHVPGVPVTDYCDAHRLPIARRIELFITICHAVQHAHQKGIIHRDLKPSNILVAERDGEIVPKVIDFGVAKAIRAPLTAHTLVTQQGRLLGTPEYMSPEQAGTGGVDVDTRTDIYSLGVLLYQLLTGRLPLPREALREGDVAEVMRTIRDRTPPRPSTCFAGRDPDEGRAAARAGDVRALERQLRGDLDWIVMKALEKDRTRRYESAAGLAHDLERHLRNEPVVARPPSALYRLGKLTRRHKAGFAAAAVIVLALVAGIVGTSIGLWRARAAEALARADRDAAQLAGRRAAEAGAAAEAARKIADASAEELRRTLYTHQVALAQNAYRSDSVSRMKELLDAAQPERRGWEWEYLHWLADSSALTLRGHGQAVRCVAVTPDGSRIITGGWDRNIIIWDAQTGRELHRISGHYHSVHSLAVHPDGKRLFSGSYDHTLRVWDLDTGRQLGAFSGPHDEIWGIALSRDGTRLAAGSTDQSVWVWDVATGRMLTQHARHGGRVTEVAFTADGSKVISAGSDATIRVADIDSHAEVAVWRGHTWRINCLALSPDGRLAASGDDDKVVIIWEVATGRQVAALRGHGAGIMSLAFSPDGRQLVTGSWDKKIKLWDLATGQAVLTLPGHGDVVWAVRFSPDGTRIISGGNDWTAKVWDLGAGSEVTRLAGHHLAVTEITWSPDGQLLASGGWDATVRIWDAASCAELHTIRTHHSSLASLAFNPDGRQLRSFEHLGHLATIDVATGTVQSMRDITPRWRAGGLLSSDGRLVGARDDTGLPAIFDADTGRLLGRLEERDITEGAISPDHAHLAVATAEGQLRVVEIPSSRRVWTAEGHPFPIRCLAFSADGTQLASGGDDRAVKLWDVATGRLLRTFSGHELGVSCVTFAPDGSRLATGADDRTVKLWDPATGQEVLTLRGHEEGLTAVVFSPDGRVLASAAQDWTIRLWECRPPAGGLARRAVVLAAQQLVHQLGKYNDFSGDIADAIEADATLSAAIREEALRLVGVQGDDPEVLRQRVWQMLIEPKPERPERAQRYAEALLRLSPEDGNARDACGAALYRLGRYEEALAALAPEQLARRSAYNRAIAALALHQLHRPDEAREMLSQLRFQMLHPENLGCPIRRALLHEAAQAIDPPPETPERE